MKKIVVAIAVVTLPLFAFSADDVGAIAKFENLNCRKFDYYQLKGDRKVFEVAVIKNQEGTYRLDISNLYETLQTNGTYKETSRVPVQASIDSMLCTQAGEPDNKIVTCRKDKNPSFDYLSVARMDRTQVMSAMASVPAKIVHYSSYDIEFLGADGSNNTYRQFDLKDCVVN